MKPFWGVVLMVCAVLWPSIALAHPKLVKAQPARGAILKKTPTKIQLWFQEELDTKGSTFLVLDSKGAHVDNGDAKVNLDDRMMIEGSVRALPPGFYTVMWKAMADDDKAVTQGTFTFRVRE
jgi:methionine-rich copper-binding protein CopC